MSVRKTDVLVEFVPTNLHLQRMVVNNSVGKPGVNDVYTVGAFASHAHSTKSHGLIR